MGKTVTYKGNEVEVLGVKGGWTTIQKQDGTVVKVRNGELPQEPKQAKAKAARKPKAERKAGDPLPKRGVYDGDPRKLVKGLGETAGGNPTLDKNDKAAKELRGLTVDDAIDVVARALVDAGEAETISGCKEELAKAYGKLNPGLARMSLGNRLRGAYSAKSA